MRHRLRQLFAAERTKFVLLVAAAIAVHWMGGISERMLEYASEHGLKWNPYDLWLLAIPCALLAVLWQVWRHSRHHSGVIVHSSGEARFCSNLVIFLSDPCANNAPKEERDALLAALRETRLDLSTPNWCPQVLMTSAWRMPLQAISHHVRLGARTGQGLDAVYLIASWQTAEYTEMFREMVERSLGQHAIVRRTEIADFEDFQQVSTALNRVFEDVGLREEKLLIDITSGNKICSVVAAALSFEQGRHIEYVHAADGYLVKEYDLGYLSPEFLKPGG